MSEDNNEVSSNNEQNNEENKKVSEASSKEDSNQPLTKKELREQKKAERQAKRKAKKIAKKEKGNKESIYQEFKKFISRGNVLDMAVGVIMGGSFSAIASAFTAILMSVCTWGVPGGINGLVTVLPAASEAQRGVLVYTQQGDFNYNPNGLTIKIDQDDNHDAFEFKGVYLQKFDKESVNKIAVQYAAASERYALTVNDSDFNQWKNSLVGLYDLHGNTYTYKQSAVIDWGTLINAIIQFLIIAITLFAILKTYNYMKQYRLAFETQLKIKYEEAKKKKEEEQAKLLEEGKTTQEAKDTVQSNDKPLEE